MSKEQKKKLSPAQPSSVPVAKQEPRPEHLEIGRQLKERREELGWDLTYASKQTNIHHSVITQMETGNFDRMASLAYARNFLRLYARKLDLDGKVLVRQMGGSIVDDVDINELAAEKLETYEHRPDAPELTAQKLGMGLLVAVFLCVTGIVVYGAMQVWPKIVSQNSDQDEQVVIQKKDEAAKEETTPIIDGAPVTLDTPQDAKAVRLELRAEPGRPYKERFARVVVIRKGKKVTLYEDIIPDGQIVPSPGAKPWMAEEFIITLRETAAVNIIINGKNLGKYRYPGPRTVKYPLKEEKKGPSALPAPSR